MLDDVCLFYREIESLFRNHEDHPIAKWARDYQELYQSQKYIDGTIDEIDERTLQWGTKIRFEDVFPVAQSIYDTFNPGQLNLLLAFYKEKIPLQYFPYHRLHMMIFSIIEQKKHNNYRTYRDKDHPFITKLEDDAYYKSDETTLEELKQKMDFYRHEATVIRHTYAKHKINLEERPLNQETYLLFIDAMFMKEEDPTSELSETLRELENQYRMYYIAFYMKQEKDWRPIPFLCFNKNFRLMKTLPVTADPISNGHFAEVNKNLVRSVNTLENSAIVANAQPHGNRNVRSNGIIAANLYHRPEGNLALARRAQSNGSAPLAHGLIPIVTSRSLGRSLMNRFRGTRRVAPVPNNLN
jgi:hypothetical protein